MISRASGLGFELGGLCIDKACGAEVGLPLANPTRLLGRTPTLPALSSKTLKSLKPTPLQPCQYKPSIGLRPTLRTKPLNPKPLTPKPLKPKRFFLKDCDGQARAARAAMPEDLQVGL